MQWKDSSSKIRLFRNRDFAHRVTDLTGNYSFHSMAVGDIIEVGGHYFMMNESKDSIVYQGRIVEIHGRGWTPLKTLGVCASLPSKVEKQIYNNEEKCINECRCV